MPPPGNVPDRAASDLAPAPAAWARAVTTTGGDATGGSGGASMDAAPDLTPTTAPVDARDTSSESAPVAGGDASGGATDAARDAAACVNGTRDLSNVGTGNFRISFRVETTQTGWVALLNQRSTCYFGVFWDIRQAADGTLDVETDGGTSANYQVVRSTARINDGNPHDIEVARVSGVLTIKIDGTPSGMGASSAFLGALAPLKVGTNVCNGPPNNPPTAALPGGR